jgi:hypothetical protein
VSFSSNFFEPSAEGRTPLLGEFAPHPSRTAWTHALQVAWGFSTGPTACAAVRLGAHVSARHTGRAEDHGADHVGRRARRRARRLGGGGGRSVACAGRFARCALRLYAKPHPTCGRTRSPDCDSQFPIQGNTSLSLSPSSPPMPWALVRVREAWLRARRCWIRPWTTAPSGRINTSPETQGLL